MTVIDALVVVLGLDSKELENKTPAAVKKLDQLEKSGEKTEKSVAKISKTSKETSRSVEGLSRTVTAFLSIIGGTVAIKSFIQDFIDTNAQLDRLSKNLGLSVSTISAWSNASEKLGGTAQGLQGTLDMLSKSQTQLMITGESSLIPYFSALGVSLAGVNGQARPVTDILLDLADRFSKLPRTEANNLGRMIGIDQGTLNLLLQGRKEVELEISRQKEQTAVTKAQAKQAQKFQTQIAGLKQQFMALGRSLLMDAAPYIEKLLNIFQRFGDWTQEHKEFIEDFLKVIAVGLGAIAIASLPINLTVAAVIALGAAIALLWDDYQTWKKGGDSLIDWGKWQPGIDAANIAIKILTMNMRGLLDVATDLKNLFSGDHPLFRKAISSLSPVLGALGFVGSTINDGAPNPNRSRIAGSSQGTASGNPSADYIKKYFQSQGWSAAQAAGIAANLISESGGNIRASGDSGSAFGIAQWHADRQAAFAKWAGHDIHSSTLAEQLAFVQYELTHGGETAAGNALRRATTAQDAGSAVSQLYERPKDVAGEASRRGTYAQSLDGIPGAAALVTNAPAAAGAAGMIDKSIKTDIGTLVINTQATDAAGITAEIEHSLNYLFVSQANYGLN